MNKGVFVSGAIVLGALGCGVVQAKEKPNVIYLMVDDLGIGDLGCYGQRLIKTPAIDELADNGMKFMQHYSGSTVSAPSRCVLMTGKHTGNAYIRGNKGVKGEDGNPYDLALPASEVTVAEMFKEAGYKTACIGKWGLGAPSTEGHPNKQGFDYFFGYLSQINAHSFYPNQLFENNDPVMLNKKVYSHDMIVDKAMNFIEENATEPFFLYLTPTIPHAELLLPEGELMGYDGKFYEKPYKSTHYASQDKPRATFAAMVSRLDRDVKKVVELLKEKGIYDNTIIIFTSDNGTHVEGGHDPHFFDSNGPYRGTKRDLYDGGIKTPFIVQWPAAITPGSVSYHLSAFWDFMPTVGELVNIETPKESDGISFLPTLTNKGKQKKHDYLYFEFHEMGGRQAVIKDGWKLIRLNVNNPEKEKYELYNLPNDPAEVANVVKQYPEITSDLQTIMSEARTENEHFKFKFEK